MTKNRLVRALLAAAVVLTGLAAGPAAAADHDCGDSRYQQDAQEVLDGDRSDPHRLDADGDAIACERLPHRPGTPQRPPTAPTARAAAAAAHAAAAPATYSRDWDGDGRSDLLAITSDGSLRLHPGDGTGGFATTRVIGTGWQSLQLVTQAGDWDRDGKPDIIARSGSTLRLYAGDGTGRVASSRTIGTGWAVFSTVIAPGDWSGDGLSDLLAVRRDTAALWIYPGNGKGGFLAGRQIGTGWGGVGGLTSVGDWNGDRTNDLMARTRAGELRLYSGNGRGGFAGTVTYGRGWGSFTALTGPGDWTGDGRRDLLARNPAGDLLLYRGNGTGGFSRGSTRIEQGWGSVRILGSTLPSPVPAAPADAPPPTKKFPAAAVVDVTTAYGVKGDGTTDNTEALRRAVRENHGRVLYLPAGVYLVSDTIDAVDTQDRWQPYTMLQGEQRDRSVIRLAPTAAGFDDPARPKPVLRTNSGTFVEQPRPDGIGNEAFGNYVEDLTVDTGAHRGAVGLDHVASNYGAVRNVAFRGQGVTGLSMTRDLFGPGLVKNVTVTGFDVGIAVDAAEYGATFEHITLTGQRVAGMRDDGGSLAVRDLRSTNTVPALVIGGSTAQVSVVEASLHGGAAGTSAVRLTSASAGLFARDVTATGYGSVIDDNGTRTGTTAVQEWTSSPVAAPFGGDRSLHLPVRETPTFHSNDMADWANVEDYGARRDDWADDSAAIQRAIDSGKSTVYFPTGRYFTSGSIIVRGEVRLFAGLNSTVAPIGTGWGDASRPRAVFSVEDGAPEGVIFDKLFVGKFIQQESAAGVVGFRHVASRPLTLQDAACCSERNQLPVTAAATAGPLFLENVSVAGLHLTPGQQVWARQLNPEGDVKRVVNRGGTIWVLGLKMEGGQSTLETFAGGCSELLGATLYVVGDHSAVVPYVNEDSAVSISGVSTAYGPTDYRTVVRETRAGTTRVVTRDALSWRGDGRAMPLYTSGSRAGCPAR